MGLTTYQWRFIAARLLCKTDGEAAKEIGIHPQTVTNWKQESEEFVAEYEAAFQDGVHVAKQYSRKLLGKVVQRHDEALDAKERGQPNHEVRLKAGKVLLQMHGLLTDKSEVDVNLHDADDLISAFIASRNNNRESQG